MQHTSQNVESSSVPMKILMPALAMVLTSCGNGNPVERQAAVLMGMGDPGRMDAELIKIKISKNLYEIPANCFFSPISTQKLYNGYFEQGGILLRVSWPDMACRNYDNKKKFSGLNFSERMQLRLSHYDLRDRDKAFNFLLFMATHPRVSFGVDPVIDNQYTIADGETVYKIPRDHRMSSQADLVYTDKRSYYSYCIRLHKSGKESDWRDCHTTFFYRTNAVDITFDAQNFRERNLIISKTKAFLDLISK